AGDLVAARRDLAQQVSLALGDPAEHEERRARPGAVAEIAQPVGLRFGARGQLGPTSTVDVAIEIGDLKVFLQVDRERIEQFSTARGRLAPPCSCYIGQAR